ncbi:adenylylsulfatase HINT3 isoform X1 [Lolium perenne]|uniref:adenylylsulfatase HINT3 isoform X1 n=1 Tax=Lolium perenne TaxID=4522 RepID=UPI0021F59B54|nr:adenylylsulfatase HINT3 isoform X1 [Lolium perenne]
MSPPRRLAVLHSHLRPEVPPPPAGRGENELTEGQEAVVSTSPCAVAGDDRLSAAAGPVGDGELETCVFCRIIRDEAPAFKVYEDDVCLCILDSHPLAPGHSLIIPKCHFSSLEATPPTVVAAMCSKVPFLSNAIMKATQCDSFNLVVNNGAAAGQVIFHTHCHIIPRKSGDELWPTESFRRSSIEPNETSNLISCIKEQLDSSLKTVKTEAAIES